MATGRRLTRILQKAGSQLRQQFPDRAGAELIDITDDDRGVVKLDSGAIITIPFPPSGASAIGRGAKGEIQFVRRGNKQFAQWRTCCSRNPKVEEVIEIVIEGWLSYLQGQFRQAQSFKSVYPGSVTTPLISTYSGGNLTRVSDENIYSVSATGFSGGYIDTLLNIDTAGTVLSSYTNGGAIVDVAIDQTDKSVYIVEWNGPGRRWNQRSKGYSFTKTDGVFAANVESRLTKLDQELNLIWSTPWQDEVLYRQAPAIVIDNSNKLVSVYGTKVTEGVGGTPRTWLHMSSFRKTLVGDETEPLKVYGGIFPYPDSLHTRVSYGSIPRGSHLWGEDEEDEAPSFGTSTYEAATWEPMWDEAELEVLYPSAGPNSGNLNATPNSLDYRLENNLFSVQKTHDPATHNTCRLVNLFFHSGVYIPAFKRSVFLRGFSLTPADGLGKRNLEQKWTINGSLTDGLSDTSFRELYTPLLIDAQGRLLVLVEQIEYQAGWLDDAIVSFEFGDEYGVDPPTWTLETAPDVTVADQSARFSLTTGEVQNDDIVFQIDPGISYRVTDETNLNNANGYTSISNRYRVIKSRTLYLQTISCQTGETILRKEIGSRLTTKVHLPKGKPDFGTVDDPTPGAPPSGDYGHPGEVGKEYGNGGDPVGATFPFVKPEIEAEYEDFDTRELHSNGYFVYTDPTGGSYTFNQGDGNKRRYFWLGWNAPALTQHTTGPLVFDPMSCCLSSDGSKVIFGPWWRNKWGAYTDKEITINYAIRDDEDSPQTYFLRSWAGGDAYKMNVRSWFVAYDMDTLTESWRSQRLFASAPEKYTTAHPVALAGGVMFCHVREKLATVERGRIFLLYDNGGKSGEGTLASVVCTPFAAWDQHPETGPQIDFDSNAVEVLMASKLGILTKDRNFLRFMKPPT